MSQPARASTTYRARAPPLHFALRVLTASRPLRATDTNYACPVRLAAASDRSKPPDSSRPLLYVLGGIKASSHGALSMSFAGMTLGKVGEDNLGVEIFDASGPNLVALGPKFDTGAPHGGYGGGLCVSGSRAYVVGGTELIIVDVTDPAAPRKLSATNAGVQPRSGDVAVLGNVAYVFGNHGLATFYVRDPAAPQRLFPLKDQKQSNASGVYNQIVGRDTEPWKVCAKRLLVRRTAAGVHAFFSTPFTWGVYDVSSPAAPRLVFQKNNKCGDAQAIQAQSFIGSGLAFAGEAHLLITGFDGIAVWDVSSPAKPALVGFNHVAKKKGGDGKHFTAWRGWGSEVVVQSGFAFTMSPWKGLVVYDVRQPTRPAFVARRKPEDMGNRLKDWALALTANGRAYAAPTVIGTVITTFDVTDPAQWPCEEPPRPGCADGGCCIWCW